jgi:hypothetical protein
MGASFSCQIAIEACLFAIRTRCGAFLVACAEWLSRRGALLRKSITPSKGVRFAPPARVGHNRGLARAARRCFTRAWRGRSA